MQLVEGVDKVRPSMNILKKARMYQEALFPDRRHQVDNALRGAQFIMLRMLKYFDRLCADNDLSYSLEAGTLLGAIREGGFIPWDDDMDIFMPRPDYEKFIEIADSLLPPSIRLFSAQNDKAHYWPWIKLRDTAGSELDEGMPCYKGSNGVFIDIYPIDVYLPIFLKLDWPVRKCQGLARANAKWGVPVLNSLCGIFSQAICQFKQKLLRNVSGKRFGATEARYFNPYCRYLRFKEITFKYEDIFPLLRTKFEDGEFLAFNNSRRYLESMYGASYMTPPPPQHRAVHARNIKI